MNKLVSKLSFDLTKNIFKLPIRFFSINHNLSKFNFRSFSTGNTQMTEKESLELVEAGVFEILKGAAKCKQDKLNRAATFEELGKKMI